VKAVTRVHIEVAVDAKIVVNVLLVLMENTKLALVVNLAYFVMLLIVVLENTSIRVGGHILGNVVHVKLV
tara:strand:+ start:467 stop:676 length:210 start_codon:yes stop_codon:yes gene_type:complete